MQFGGVEMRKHVPRRALVVAALLVVSSAAMAAVAVSSGGETTGKNATRAFGIARASSVGSSSSLSGTSLASTATAGPQVIDGKFQGTSPDVASLPVLPVPQAPLHTLGIEALKPSGT